MKLRYLFVSLLAVLGLAVACETEEDHYLDEVKVSSSYLAFPAEGGSVTFSLSAEEAWSITDTPEWLTVSPSSGGAGEVNVTATATAAEDTRSGNFNIVCGGKTQIVSLIQMTEKTELPVTSIADVIAAGAGSFRVKGTVTKVANTQYGNIYINDGSTDTNLYIYGTKKDGAYPKDSTGGWDSFGIEPGDIITVEGPFTLYNGTTPEIIDGELISVEKSLIQVAAFDFETLPAEAGSFSMTVNAKVSPILVTTESEWLHVTDVAAGGVYVLTYDENTRTATRTATITIKGPGALKTVDVSQIGVPASGASVTEIIAMEDDSQVQTLQSTTTVAKTTKGIVVSDGESAVYVYGTAVDAIKLGDNVQISAKKTTYNGVPELTDVTEVVVDSEGNTVKHPEAKDITATATEYTADKAEFITLSGTLSVSDDGKYYNMEIDGVDKTVKQGSIVYPVESLNAKSFNGKKITVTGYFNGISGKGVYINIIATKISEFVENPKGTITNPYGADELAALLLAGETFDSEVYAKGKINKIDSISWDVNAEKYYGNAQYWISDDGTESYQMEVYRGFWFNGDKFTAEDQIKVGDEVLVYGKVKLYVNGDNKTPEFDSGNYIVTLNGKAAPKGDGTAENPYNVTKLVDMLLAGETPSAEVYGKGIITKIDSISWDVNAEKYYGNAQYWISDDGTESYQMEVYRGFWFNGDKFTAEDQIKVGDEVLVYGKVKLYVNGDNKTPEFDAGNYIVSLNGKTE